MEKMGLFLTGETARIIGISMARLLSWEKLGIVRPQIILKRGKMVRTYSGEDIHRAVLVKTLMENEKYSLRRAIKKLDEEKVV